MFLRSTVQDITANWKTSTYFHTMAHKPQGAKKKKKIPRPLEKENSTGLKMTLQFMEYIVTSLKRKVNQSCYFATFFHYKKDEDLSFIKVGFFILKESGKKILPCNISKQETFQVSSTSFFPRIILTFVTKHTQYTFV